jgi:hypothetical protein
MDFFILILRLNFPYTLNLTMLSLPLLSLLLVATTGLAAPSLKERDTAPVVVPVSALYLPSNQTQILRPTTNPDYVAIGVGNQNYTCTDSGNYTSSGTVAQMLDISQLYGTSEFSRVQDDAFDIWWNYSSTNPYDDGLTVLLNRELGVDLLGQYYFINGTNGTLVPKFDFTSSGPNKGNLEAFVVAARVGDIPAPIPEDIDWVELNRTSGELANEVIRVNTRAGQPPSSCKPGSTEITVKYCAVYWFFGSTLNSSVTSN